MTSELWAPLETLVFVVPDSCFEDSVCDPPDPCLETAVLVPSPDCCFGTFGFRAPEGGRLFKVLPFCKPSVERCRATGFFVAPVLPFA